MVLAARTVHAKGETALRQRGAGVENHFPSAIRLLAPDRQILSAPLGDFAVHRLTAGGRRFFLLVAEPLDSVAAERAIVRRVTLIALPLILAFAGLGGYVLAARSLAPLGWMALQAQKITGPWAAMDPVIPSQ